MKPSYIDIHCRIKEEPKWYDRNGCPRYDPFSPTMCSDPHAQEVALLEVHCRECERSFLVEMTWSDDNHKQPSIIESLQNGKILSYAHPPTHRHYTECKTGDNIPSVTKRVVRLWRKERSWTEIDPHTLSPLSAAF